MRSQFHRARDSPQLDHRELAADQQIAHALSRLTFGATPGDPARVRSVGLEKWVDEQLRPERISDKASESVLRRYSVLNDDAGDMLREFTGMQRERRQTRRAGDSAAMNPRERRGAATTRRALIGEVQSARVSRAVTTERQLQEVVTDFWLNHFNVFAQKGPPQPFYIPAYEASIRKHSLGKFRDLLGSVAKSPAMLFYLDNARSMGDTTKPRLATVNDRRRRRSHRTCSRMQRALKRGVEENYARDCVIT